MKKANYADKLLIVDILTRSFETNLSVNYVVKQDRNREQRISALMDYSFEVCYLSGEVLLSNDNMACALIIYPDRKKATLKSIWLDVKLIIQCIGLGNISKTLRREKLISSIQPKIRKAHLWFIGVDSRAHGQGKGGKLLQSIIDYCTADNRPIYLETSTVKNLPWYKKFGFEVYSEQDLTYRLFFFKRDVK